MRRGSKIIAGIWGLAEATGFFIVPDVYLSYLAVTDYRKALRACIYCVVGALLGGAAMYGFGHYDSKTAFRFLGGIPAISPRLIEQGAILLQESTFIGMVKGSLSGIPYKIFAVHAGNMGIPVLAFLIYSIPARLLRFILAISISSLIASILLKYLRPKAVKVFHAITWLLFYIGYFRLMGI